MERRYKPILPAAVAPPPDKPGDEKEPEQPTVPKRRRIATACEECRSRKVACDGNHPCASCADRKAACVFRNNRKDSGLQGRFQEHVDLLQQLAMGPEADAVEMLRRLRASGDIGSVHASFRGSMSNKVRPSFLETARAVSPPSSSSLEFELASLHHNAYPVLIPVDLTSISMPAPGSSRPAPGQPPLPLLHDPAAATGPNALTIDHAPFPIRGQAAPGAAPSVAGPFRPPTLCDERLHRVRMDYWTRVPISDDFAARVLSSYLIRDHPILGLFDADLFLDDLIGKCLDFCSPLLVSALMFHACHSYHAVDARSVALARFFSAETEMLWQSERSSDSLNTLIAIHLYCMMLTAQGKDERTPELVLEGRRMAERMQLFGLRHDPTLAASFAALSPKWKRAMAHTAWGVYNWLTHRYCFYAGKSIPFSPIFPVPGDHEQTEMLGLQWPAHPLPAYIGSTFPALCRFWPIVQEVSAVYLEETGVPLTERVSVSFAEAKYRKLLAWSDTLTSAALRGDQRPAPAHVLLLHMYYHAAILDLFRPFMGRPTAHCLASFSSHGSHPSQIFTASLKQFKRLMLTLHLHCPPAERSSFLISTLIHLCGGLLHNIDDPEWKFYFILCLALGSQLGVSFGALGPVIKGSLVMAVRRGALTNTEALELSKTYVPAAPAPERAQSVCFVLDLDLAMTARQDAVADALARAFEDLRLFGEWVNEEGADEDDEKAPDPIAPEQETPSAV